MPTYANLTGDLDAKPALLELLQAFAASVGKVFHITSGGRTYAEQAALYANRANNPYPVAKPGSSRHETGNAADVTVDGKPIQNVFTTAQLEKAGLKPLAGDAVHVEMGAGSGTGGVGFGVFGSNLLPAAAGAVGGAIGAGADVVTGAAEDGASATAKATANAVLDLLVGAIGDKGARIAVTVALVAGGLVLFAVGAGRMLGLGEKAKTGGRMAVAGAELYATRGTSAAKKT